MPEGQIHPFAFILHPYAQRRFPLPRVAGRHGKLFTRMRRKLFTLAAALSAALCAATVVLWVRGGRVRTAMEFRRADGVWEVASASGRLCVDNAPQCRLEREHTLGERRRLSRECVNLARENSLLRKRLERLTGDDDDRDGTVRMAIESELARVGELAKANANDRRAIFAAPEATTAPVTRSAPAFAVAGPAALPPVAWLALAARARRRRRTQLKHGL